MANTKEELIEAVFDLINEESMTMSKEEYRDALFEIADDCKTRAQAIQE